MSTQIKRIYEAPADSDGFRVLVDRLWPRGVSKQKAQLDLWLKDIAPSPDLRTWFGHKPDRFPEFRTRYVIELEHNPAVAQLQEIIHQNSQTTLLYAARNPQINHAAVLREFLNHR